MLTATEAHDQFDDVLRFVVTYSGGALETWRVVGRARFSPSRRVSDRLAGTGCAATRRACHPPAISALRHVNPTRAKGLSHAQERTALFSEEDQHVLGRSDRAAPATARGCAGPHKIELINCRYATGDPARRPVVGVGRGLECGSEDRSTMPASPSAR